MRKIYSLKIVLIIAMVLVESLAFAKTQKVGSLDIDLAKPQKSNALKRVLDISTEPVLVTGKIPLTIPIIPNAKDTQRDRYLVEYFIDGNLVYETNGIVKNSNSPSFNWTLDTTKYKNGTHKLTVNYWDEESPSMIGIKYFIVDNPVTVEDLLK